MIYPLDPLCITPDKRARNDIYRKRFKVIELIFHFDFSAAPCACGAACSQSIIFTRYPLSK